jgi:hypothetical protein
MKRWHLLLFAAIALAAWWYMTGQSPADILASVTNSIDDVATRGPRLTRCTPSRAEIVAGAPVNESPDELTAQAIAVLGYEIEVDDNTGGRAVRSERAQGKADLEAAIISHVILNYCRRKGASVTEVLCGSDYRYGRQQGGYCSTTADPCKRDVEIFRACRLGQIPDLTGGATHWLHPKGFKTREQYLATRKRWIEEYGWTPVTLPDGIDWIEVYAS